MAKDRKMAGWGVKGYKGLRKKLGAEGLRKHMSKLAKKRWAKHKKEKVYG